MNVPGVEFDFGKNKTSLLMRVHKANVEQYEETFFEVRMQVNSKSRTDHNP